MNEMRKLMEMVESSENDAAYVAANLYLAHPGLVKPALAKEVSSQTGIDYNVAVLMIDAIDAYEDIRETFVKEDTTDIQYPDYTDNEENEYEAFAAGIEIGGEWQYEFGGTGEDGDKRRAYDKWVEDGREIK